MTSSHLTKCQTQLSQKVILIKYFVILDYQLRKPYFVFSFIPEQGVR